MKPLRSNKRTNPFHNSTLRAAGSNTLTASQVFDGNITTGWQPNSTDPEQWWIEIDLGQVLPMQQLVLHFDPSQPPLSFFTVSLSKGENFINNANVIVEGTLIYNQRKIFSFNKKNLIEIALDNQLVRVVKIASDRYDGTRPLLLEIEGKAMGDNIALNLVSKGGSVNVEADIVAIAGTPTVMFDGDLSTMWRVNPLAKGSSGGSETFGDYRIDLGAVYPIDSMWLLGEPLGVPPRLRHFYANFLSYKIFFSDGSLSPDGTLSWTELISVPADPQNLLSKRNFNHNFDPFTARYLRLLYPTSEGGNIIGGGLSTNSVRLDGLGLVSEFQIYGDGYPAEVSLRSPVIDLKENWNIETINWLGQFPQGTQLRVRSRTGDNIVEEKHYYDKNGKEVTSARHRKLIPSFRGPIETTLQPGNDWSTWSEDYQTSGSLFNSPSPRQYLQLEIDLLSDKAETALALSELSIEYTAPLAREAIGEIHPKITTAGQEQSFTYYLRSKSTSRNQGFQHITLQSSIPLKFLSARINNDLVKTNLFVKDQGFALTLPQVIYENALIEIDFLATPFQNKTRIYSLLELKAGESLVRQQVDPGDAVTEIDGYGDSITIPVDNNLISSLKSNRVFTPNGDGINDLLNLNFDILKVASPRQIAIQVYNLTGRPVRKLLNTTGTSGHYRVDWNGYFDEQILAPPGLYILRVSVQGDARTHSLSRLVGVHY
ncbi:MAG: gliding motility-associated C-terminal domain-containing protein [Candidatus Latescibacterota bacterium]|nr:gliding motility-associated C-terminal domain-containing protein [Candidatus Latescibacterota bacterium]